MSDQPGRIVWEGPPDPDRGIFYQILAPKAGSKLMGVIVNETLLGVQTHWIFDPATPGRGRTVPCTYPPSSCPGCSSNIALRWKGYLGCWNHLTGRLFIAEVTREAYLRCPGFELWKGSLRGKVLELHRQGQAANSRVNARLLEYAMQVESVPPAFNLQSALERIWFGKWGAPGEDRPHDADVPKPRKPRGPRGCVGA